MRFAILQGASACVVFPIYLHHGNPPHTIYAFSMHCSNPPYRIYAGLRAISFPGRGSSRSDRRSVIRRNTGRGTMVTGSDFQHVLEIVRRWWLCGWHVRGQYELGDGNRHDPLHFCAAHTSRHESQRRGTAHLHFLIWHWPLPLVPQVVPTAGAVHPGIS